MQEASKVLISHAAVDSELAAIVKGFVEDAGGGKIEAVYSSASDSDAGIPFGDKWFDWIERQLKDATLVITILTPRSVERPYVLFEAGAAHILGKTPWGLLLGLDESRVEGPFKVFQLARSDRNDVTKLFNQITASVNLKLSERMVSASVSDFLERINSISIDPPVQRTEADMLEDVVRRLSSLETASEQSNGQLARLSEKVRRTGPPNSIDKAVQMQIGLLRLRSPELAEMNSQQLADIKNALQLNALAYQILRRRTPTDIAIPSDLIRQIEGLVAIYGVDVPDDELDKAVAPYRRGHIGVSETEALRALYQVPEDSTGNLKGKKLFPDLHPLTPGDGDERSVSLD